MIIPKTFLVATVALTGLLFAPAPASKKPTSTKFREHAEPSAYRAGVQEKEAPRCFEWVKK
jgi:hypothetical protein